MDKAGNGAAETKNILVVEDEIMIRMLLEDMLDDLGYTIAGAVGRIDDAIKLARTGEFDMAILDVNLNGQTVSPVAEILEERGLPFVFATGYGETGGAPGGFDAPIIRKPYDVTQVAAAVAELLAQPSSDRAPAA